MGNAGEYFDSLCRTCMNVETCSYGVNNKPQQEQWLSIFDKIEECAALPIVKLLSNTVPQMDVQLRDGLPKKICWQCMQQLLTFYQFQKMCVKSEELLREMVSIMQTRSKVPPLEPPMESEIQTTNAVSDTFKNSCSNSTLTNLQQPSIQESIAEATEQKIKLEADDLQNLKKLMELCGDTQCDFSGFIKIEPTEDDEQNIGYRDSGTMHSTISMMKEELVPIKPEQQQLNASASRYNCHLCPKSLKTKRILENHLKLHREKAISEKHCFDCHLCAETYISQRGLTGHLKQYHSLVITPYACHYCGKSFPGSAQLKRHIRKHTDERPYTFPECGKSF